MSNVVLMDGSKCMNLFDCEKTVEELNSLVIFQHIVALAPLVFVFLLSNLVLSILYTMCTWVVPLCTLDEIQIACKRMRVRIVTRLLHYFIQFQ